MTSVAHARGSSPPDRLLRTAARGAILIGVAVLIGIVLLQVVDDAQGPTNASGNGGPKTTTTSEPGARPPQDVSVAVYNASGQSGAALAQSNTLLGLGYKTPITENAATQQVGTTVACETGYEAEAEQLIAVVPNSSIAAFPDPPPAGAEDVNCIVILGT